MSPAEGAWAHDFSEPDMSPAEDAWSHDFSEPDEETPVGPNPGGDDCLNPPEDSPEGLRCGEDEIDISELGDLGEEEEDEAGADAEDEDEEDFAGVPEKILIQEGRALAESFDELVFAEMADKDPKPKSPPKAAPKPPPKAIPLPVGAIAMEVKNTTTRSIKTSFRMSVAPNLSSGSDLTAGYFEEYDNVTGKLVKTIHAEDGHHGVYDLVGGRTLVIYFMLPKGKAIPKSGKLSNMVWGDPLHKVTGPVSTIQYATSNAKFQDSSGTVITVPLKAGRRYEFVGKPLPEPRPSPPKRIEK